MPFVAHPWQVQLYTHECFHSELPSPSRCTSNKKTKKKNDKEHILEVIEKLRTTPNTICIFTDGSLSEGKWMHTGVGVSMWAKDTRAFEHAVTSRREATSYNAEMYMLVHGLSATI
jgi:hypothetical protein